MKHFAPCYAKLGDFTAEARGPYASSFLEQIDLLRAEACLQLDRQKQAEKGQFLTPAAVAGLMATMVTADTPTVQLLDAGAGIGSLFAACIAVLCRKPNPPRAIHVTAYETEPLFWRYLQTVATLCKQECERADIALTVDIRPVDFIQAAVGLLQGDLFTAPLPPFTCAILNPPYRKIHSASAPRCLLRQAGIETSNLYTGFLALAIQLLAERGELVAITPRSFCNGAYFRPFRNLLLQKMGLNRIHLFDSRQEAFRNDVLQETIIIHAAKGAAQPERVVVSSSTGAEDDLILRAERPYDSVVFPDDAEQFIRVVPDGINARIVARMASFQTRLQDMGVSASTGRVVDFRAEPYLRTQPGPETAPLLYPTNLENGTVQWPRQTKKPQALAVCQETELLFVPNATYVLVKRFSSKEEKRRLVAAVCESGQLPGDYLGFENHLNYFHQNGCGLDLPLARGLTLFLNATLLDTYFRQFSGHTQVNATDLRNMRYPTQEQLRSLGNRIGARQPSQEEIDTIIQQEFFGMTEDSGDDPILTQRRIDIARALLEAIGLPKAQCNERSALTLLALLDLKPTDPWATASNPLRGIHGIIAFVEQVYSKSYAENSRESIRKSTIHQFVDAGLLVRNPDDPSRPTNSGKTVYQIETDALELLRTYDTSEWEPNLKAYLASVITLRERYAQQRYLARIPVEIALGVSLTLSPGGQNVLVKQIVEEFAPRFTPSGKLLYVGDTGEKFALFDEQALKTMGVTIESHGKMPDVIVHYTEKNWLVVVEAVTSHGPINPKRKAELMDLFRSSRAGLVLVTAFLTRKALKEYLPEISWETEVWIAEAPDHLIHFNGERFLGPY